jgi:anti-anti-sigma factor
LRLSTRCARGLPISNPTFPFAIPVRGYPRRTQTASATQARWQAGAGAERWCALAGQEIDLGGYGTEDGQNGQPASQRAPFRIEARRDGGRVHVELIGELDGRTKNPLYHLFWMLRERHASEVVLDLRRLGFIDKNGLKEVLLLRRKSELDGFGLRLVGVSEETARRFSARGLDRVFGLAR